jgi:UDPglucose 6-dehydrogenase
VAVLGVTFKPNTDDMRDSPSLDIIPALQAAGARVHAFDPEGMHEAEKLLPGVTWAKSTYETMNGADGVVILTEWNEFRALDFAKMKASLKRPVLIDLRNIYTPREVAEAGFEYHSIGRTAHKPT